MSQEVEAKNCRAALIEDMNDEFHLGQEAAKRHRMTKCVVPLVANAVYRIRFPLFARMESKMNLPQFLFKCTRWLPFPTMKSRVKRKNIGDDDPFPIRFHFERRPLKISENQFVRLCDDAIDRAIMKVPFRSPLFLGTRFTALYELTNGLYFAFVCNSPDYYSSIGLDLDPHSRVAKIEHFPTEKAAMFFIRHNAEPFESLLPAVEELRIRMQRPKTEVVRPFSHWIKIGQLGGISPQQAHEVNLVSKLKSIAELGASWVAQKRDIESRPSLQIRRCGLDMLVGQLLERYPVSIHEHKSNWKSAPQANVSIMDLDFPKDLRHAKKTIRDLADLIIGPACVFAATRLGYDNPNESEVAHAELHLTEKLDRIDKLVCQLTSQVQTHYAAVAQQTRNASLDTSCLSDTEKLAWQCLNSAYEELGYSATDEEVFEFLTNRDQDSFPIRWTKPTSFQKQVSRARSKLGCPKRNPRRPSTDHPSVKDLEFDNQDC